jgi:hypothetical protein
MLCNSIARVIKFCAELTQVLNNASLRAAARHWGHMPCISLSPPRGRREPRKWRGRGLSTLCPARETLEFHQKAVHWAFKNRTPRHDQQSNVELWKMHFLFPDPVTVRPVRKSELWSLMTLDIHNSFSLWRASEVPSMLHGLFHLTPTRILWSKQCSVHYSDEDTEAQRG